MNESDKKRLGLYENWCVSSHRTYSWLPRDSVFACLGVQIGMVGEVSEKIRWPFLNLDLGGTIDEA